ncbi:hypothetical protein MRX96_022705 [Rhipicephalus microplus]
MTAGHHSSPITRRRRLRRLIATVVVVVSAAQPGDSAQQCVKRSRSDRAPASHFLPPFSFLAGVALRVVPSSSVPVFLHPFRQPYCASSTPKNPRSRSADPKGLTAA